MRVVARRIQHFSDEIEVHDIAMKQLVDDTAPQLVAESRFGYVTAAMFVIAWSHPGRCRSEAAYARLGGVAPIPANSGQSQDRHRLNRYGDAYSAAVTTLSVWLVVFVIVHLTPRVF
jgi:transposase